MKVLDQSDDFANQCSNTATDESVTSPYFKKVKKINNIIIGIAQRVLLLLTMQSESASHYLSNKKQKHETNCIA